MKKRFDKNYDGSPIFWLSTRINENKPMCYYLNPPGGHIEPGASRRQTLIRETLEEASILQHKMIIHLNLHKDSQNKKKQEIKK